jgi:hypothetical protein
MEPMDCLVIYVPTDAAPAARQAIGDAGAGRLGKYSHWFGATSAGPVEFLSLIGKQDQRTHVRAAPKRDG